MSGEGESVVLCGSTLEANQRCKYLRGDEGFFVRAGVDLCGKGKGMDAEEFSGEDCQEGDGKDPEVQNKGDSGETAGANPEVISNGGSVASIEEQDSQKSQESIAKDVQSKEIACKIFRIQSKKYYIDVMENKRGRYIKVVEVSADGRKNKMNISMATAAKLRNELKSFGDFYMSLGPEKEENVSGDGVLKKAIIVEKSKRYFLDFKTNGRVRFLLVSQAVWGGARVQIAIPALGIVEWRNNLTDLLEKFASDEEEVVDELPEGSCLKAKSNKFYFDILAKSNKFGEMEKIENKNSENSSKRSFEDDLLTCSQRIKTSKRARIDSDSDLCKESFQSQSEMSRHQQRKHKDEDSSVSCDICGKRFGKEASLMDHRKAKHTNHGNSREEVGTDDRRKRNRPPKRERNKLQSEAFFAKLDKKRSEGDKAAGREIGFNFTKNNLISKNNDSESMDETKEDFCGYCYNQDVVQLGVDVSKDENNYNSETIEDQNVLSTLSTNVLTLDSRDFRENEKIKQQEKEQLVDDAITIAINSNLMRNNKYEDSNGMLQNEMTKGKHSDSNQNEVTGGEVKVLECRVGEENFTKKIVMLKHLELLRCLMVHYGPNKFTRT